MSDHRQELVERLLEHCSQLCVTGEEGPIADAVEQRYRELGEEVVRVGDSVVVGGPAGEMSGGPLVLLVGHLDVVPPTEDDLRARVERREDGPVVVGRGSSDMKAGNVVAMAAFEDLDLRRASPYRLGLVLYAGEEGAAEQNQLRDVLEEVTWLREAALAVVLEPTNGEVQLGCLGGLHAEVVFRGRQAHSARPWDGENAVTLAAEFLTELRDDHLREVAVDGITYTDVWSVTQAWSAGLGPASDTRATIPRNVIPGSFTLNLNLRYAPSRDEETAERELRERVAGRAEVRVVDRSPGAPPRLHEPTVRAFVGAVAAPVAGKQAWTDVARFAQVGVPGLNFGPGLTAQAHQRGEFVPIDALVDAHARLTRFLWGEAR